MPAPADRDFACLRWAFTLALTYLILFTEEPGPAPPALAYVAILLLSNVLLFRSRRRPDTRSLFVLDSAFLVVGLFLYSGTTQELLIAYFLCIVMAALAQSEHALAGVSFLVAAAYAAWVLPQAQAGTPLWIRIPFLFVTTVFYGYMMQRLRAERSRRRSAEDGMRRLDALLAVTRSFSSALTTDAILERIGGTIRDALGARECRIRLVATGDADPLEPEAIDALTRRETVRGRILALPILYEHQILGVLVVERDDPAFEEEEIALCEVVAHAAAPALHAARQYERLAEIERRTSEFLIRFSHELRNPLMTIRLSLDIALEEAARAGSDSLVENVGQIERSVSYLSEQIESLTNASREQLGAESAHIERLDLKELVECSLQKAAPAAEGRPADANVEIHAGPDEIYADRARIQRILDPLLSSIVRRNPRRQVRISAIVAAAPVFAPPGRPWERLLSVSIQDRGTSFETGSARTPLPATRRDGALAASLDLGRTLVRALRGSIEVERVPDEGALLHLRVPVEVRARTS